MSDIPMRFCESYYTDPVESVDEADSTIVEEEVFEECDWFIQLGDSLFYVSEYHNALFDDPDAHDEAVNEFGILLDSYDDGIIQEASVQRPYDAYLKKHKYNPKNNTIEDPNRPGKRISAGKIGSAKERNRLNKFLRDNDFDPKTETIQTDVNDPNNKGSKMRIKFTMDPHRQDAAYVRPDDPGKTMINLTKAVTHAKPASSNSVLKHEEGHVNQFTNYKHAKKRTSEFQASLFGDTKGWNEKPTSPEDKTRMASAKQYLGRLNSSGKSDRFNSHERDAKEYEADAYGATHNPHDRKGTAGRSALMKLAHDAVKQEVRKESRDLDKYAKLIKSVASLDIFNKSDCPDDDSSDEKWAAFLAKHASKPSLFKSYLKQTALENEYYAAKRTRDKLLEQRGTGSFNREKYIEIDRKVDTLEAQVYGDEVLCQEYDEAYEIIKAFKYYSMYKGYLTANGKLSTAFAKIPENYKAGLDARGDFYQKHHAKQQKANQAAERKQRQLSKEQLKQQIDSGKLSKDQLAKAKRKLQRIEQFEKSQRK